MAAGDLGATLTGRAGQVEPTLSALPPSDGEAAEQLASEAPREQKSDTGDYVAVSARKPKTGETTGCFPPLAGQVVKAGLVPAV